MRIPALRIGWLLAAGVLASACSSLNPFASTKLKPEPLVEFTPRAELVQRWQVEVGKAGNQVFEPAVVGERIFAASHGGTLASFRDGQPLWRIDTGSRLSAGVGANHALAVVVSSSGEAMAYDADLGSERWRVNIGAEVLAPPAVEGDLVVLRASDHRLIALSAHDGSRRWVYQRANPPLALRSFAGVVIDDNVVLAGFPGGKLAIINALNGGTITELSVANPRGATELERVADVAGVPVVGRRELCAVTYQGRAACFDAGSGNTLWGRDFSSSVGMDRDARFAVISDERDVVHGLDVYSGATLWTQDALQRRAVSRPLIVGDYVVVGDGEGYVHVLDRENGDFVARQRTSAAAIAAPPRPYGQGFAVQNTDGRLVVYELH